MTDSIDYALAALAPPGGDNLPTITDNAPDRAHEVAALQAARAEIEALLAPDDPQAIRRRLAASLLLCERLAAVYTLRAEREAKRPEARAVLAGVALRAINVGTRVAVALAAIPAHPATKEIG
jgi:hypothetical protein